MPINAPLAEYPEFNSKERHWIGVIINQRDHLVSIEPDSPLVRKRIEAFNWALEAIKDEKADIYDDLFYVLQGRRNTLEQLPESEMNGFLGAELRAIDWLMEELIPGSGHYAYRRKLKPWYVRNKMAEYSSFEVGVVLAETAEEAIDLVLSTDKVRYANEELREVHLGHVIEFEATELSFRRGLLFHSDLR
jgi:hypothetical protein